ncbi:MAG: CBS domain-containing protein [Longimicrobiaceae bacterium]
MGLTDLLAAENVIIPLRAGTVKEAVHELGETLVGSGVLASPEPVEELLREDRLTRVAERAVLAQVRGDQVSRLAVALGVSRAPLPFRGEGKGKIVVLVVAPRSQTDPFLQLVSALVRALRDAATVELLESAGSASDVLAVPGLREIELESRLYVRDVMTQRVHQVTPETTLRELVDLITRYRLRAVPVVGEKREVLGLVTDRDILEYLLPRLRRGEKKELEGKPLREVQVREVMSRSVMCVSEDETLQEAAAVMIHKDVERFPVVKEGEMTGFLTRGDLIRKLFG